MALDLTYFTGGPRERVLEAVLEAGHRVNRVYANDPRRWPKVQPSLDLCAARGVPVTIVFAKAELNAIGEALEGRLLLSAGFNYLFPKSLLDRLGACLNVHGSLLPAYPGARTLSWCLEAGEMQSGVTVHAIDAGVDTGPILLQRSFPLSPFETTRSLGRKTGALEPQVVVEALALFERKGEAAFRPQRRLDAPAPPNRIPEHSRLDPERPLRELFNKIRAADPDHYPAYFEVEGQKVCLRLWRPDKPADEEDLI